VGSYTLLAAALAYWRELPSQQRDTFRFLHVSTDEVFGSPGADGYFAICYIDVSKGRFDVVLLADNQSHGI
jgi:dTDP-D-glucose 4,6-dehydratase